MRLIPPAVVFDLSRLFDKGIAREPPDSRWYTNSGYPLPILVCRVTTGKSRGRYDAPYPVSALCLCLILSADIELAMNDALLIYSRAGLAFPFGRADPCSQAENPDHCGDDCILPCGGVTSEWGGNKTSVG